MRSPNNKNMRTKSRRVLKGAAQVAARVWELSGVAVTPSTVRRWTAGMKDGTERKLRATRVGRLILVNERDLLAFLNLGGAQ